jgi:hypothetical protein
VGKEGNVSATLDGNDVISPEQVSSDEVTNVAGVAIFGSGA